VTNKKKIGGFLVRLNNGGSESYFTSPYIICHFASKGDHGYLHARVYHTEEKYGLRCTIDVSEKPIKAEGDLNNLIEKILDKTSLQHALEAKIPKFQPGAKKTSQIGIYLEDKRPTQK